MSVIGSYIGYKVARKKKMIFLAGVFVVIGAVVFVIGLILIALSPASELL
jgi:t-SNARE complex subunit (syntaxin)